jgi:hypothetical protein
MTVEAAEPHTTGRRMPRQALAAGPAGALAVAAGAGWGIAFAVVGVCYRLQMYGDGSIFSYAVAADASWLFHWHNISGRLFTYAFAHVPAEIVGTLSGSARAAIALYGLLFFAAPALGLAATAVADRSPGRVVFVFACATTAQLCPLVFGAPTETWMAHAVFWPALALCRDAARGRAGAARVFAALLALVFTHEGALLFVAAILLTLRLRGRGDPAFRRARNATAAALAIWAAVKLALRPDDYFASVFLAAAEHVFDPQILAGGLVLLLGATLGGYALLYLGLRRAAPETAHLYAAAAVALALAAYWLRFDHALHTDNRYYLRTLVLIFTPAFGIAAGCFALAAQGRLRLPAVLPARAARRFACGALLLVTLVHAVETVKFVSGWGAYTAALRRLATGSASDPALGDARFVSAARSSLASKTVTNDTLRERTS